MKYNIYSPISLSLILLVKAFVMLAFILYGNIGLGPDEAQYWTWSQHLDWGYYSKPPGIAWQIWLGTLLFDNTELGVRFFSVVLSFLLSLSTYFIAKACHLNLKTAVQGDKVMQDFESESLAMGVDHSLRVKATPIASDYGSKDSINLSSSTAVFRLKPQIAFWSAIVMAFCPLGIMSSYLAITDGGMVLSWSLATLVMVSALANKTTPNYLLLGFILLFGALFKWPIYLFWIVILPFIYLYHYLRSPRFFWGVAISILGLLPSVVWNASHDWVTFRHVISTIMGGHSPAENGSKLFQGNTLDFIGSQLALLSPILFVILIIAFIYLCRSFKSIPLSVRFCGITSLGILSGYALLSMFQKIQGNWSDFAYPPAIVFLTWFACEKLTHGLAWIKAGVAVSCILCAFIFSIPYIQSHALLSSYPIPYKINPFKHNVGWDRLTEILKEIGYDSRQNFLFSDKYQTTSILSFYGPNQERAYFLNLHGIRKNQFSFWKSMSQEQIGKTGFFVLTENSPHLEKELPNHHDFYHNELKKYFSDVQLMGIFPLFESDGRIAKGALIFKCIKYNGHEPPEVNLY